MDVIGSILIEKQKLNYIEQMTKERFFVLKEFKADDDYSQLI